MFTAMREAREVPMGWNAFGAMREIVHIYCHVWKKYRSENHDTTRIVARVHLLHSLIDVLQSEVMRDQFIQLVFPTAIEIHGEWDVLGWSRGPVQARH